MAQFWYYSTTTYKSCSISFLNLKNSFYKIETRRIGAPVVQADNYINQYLWVMQQTKHGWRVGGDPPKQHLFVNHWKFNLNLVESDSAVESFSLN